MQRLAQNIRDMVQAVMDHCGTTGEDVRNKLREFNRRQRAQQSLMDDMLKDMGKEPDKDAALIARMTDIEIEKQLLKLERPKGKA